MAGYYKIKKGEIYAEVAFRLGKIMLQYKEKIDQDDEENFDSTLVICALQSLLTMYTQAFDDRGCDFFNDTVNLQGEHNKNFDDIETVNFFQFKESFIQQDDWKSNKAKFVHGARRDKRLKAYSISCHLFSLRNALSHPSIKEDSTGYTSNEENNRVVEYKFTHRPKDEAKRRIYEISSDELYTLAIQLSKLLAQPFKSNWDNRLDLNILNLPYAA